MNWFILTIVLSTIMFIGSCISGIIPVVIKAPNKILNLITIVGAGLLVGVALIIIIPEGMLTLNQALVSSQTYQLKVSNTQTDPLDYQKSLMNSTSKQFMGADNEDLETSVQMYLGGSLVGGFIIMLLIDQVFYIIKERFGISGDYWNFEDHDLETNQYHMIDPCERDIFWKDLGGGPKMRSWDVNKDDFELDQDKDQFKEKKMTRKVSCCENLINTHSRDSNISKGYKRCDINKTALTVSTIGLVVHSIADGIALGSTCYASQNKNSSLPVIIFIALLLHKLPESIGFTTFLRHEGLQFNEIMIHLTCFAVTSPISAVLSYCLLSAFAVSDEGSQAFVVVGVLLLVSAGTFMYVAMLHILPEVYCNNHIHRPHTHEYFPEQHMHGDNHYSKEIELLAMIIGLLIPYLLYLI